MSGNKEFRGIKDTNLFNSALKQPMQTFDKKELYPDIISKAACYLRSFAMNHPFFDGNKRTALMAAVIFLERNGYEVISDNTKMYKFVERIVKNKMSVEEISKELKGFIKDIENRKSRISWTEFINHVKRIANKEEN